MSKYLLAMVIFATSALAPISQIQSDVSIESVEGIWIGVDGGQNVNGIGTDEIRWGITKNQQSGYIFSPASMVYPVGVTPGVSFDVATFTHNNFVVKRGTSIQGAKLATNFTLSIDGQEVNISKVYDFIHNETYNTSVGCCDDIVTAVNNTPFTESLIVGDYEYDINIKGFRVGNELFSQFNTKENQANSAALVAEVTRVAVPEPSTYLLMGSMLAFLVFYRIKRRYKLANGK